MKKISNKELILVLVFGLLFSLLYSRLGPFVGKYNYGIMGGEYIATISSLVNGYGFKGNVSTESNPEVLYVNTSYAPGLPLIGALLNTVAHIPPHSTIPIVSLISFLLLIILIYQIGNQLGGRSVALLSTLLFITSYRVLLLATAPLSDMLYALGFIYLVLKLAKQPHGTLHHSIATGGIAGLLSWTRYIGIIIPIQLCIFYVFQNKRFSYKKTNQIVVVLIAILCSIGVYIFLDYLDPGHIQSREPSERGFLTNFSHFGTALISFYLPMLIELKIRYFSILGISISCLVFTFFLYLFFSTLSKKEDSKNHLNFILATFFLTYSAALIILASVIWIDPLDPRLLLPVFPIFVIIFSTQLNQLLHTFKYKKILLASIILFPICSLTGALLQGVSVENTSFTDHYRKWIKTVEKTPRKTTIYSSNFYRDLLPFTPHHIIRPLSAIKGLKSKNGKLSRQLFLEDAQKSNAKYIVFLPNFKDRNGSTLAFKDTIRNYGEYLRTIYQIKKDTHLEVLIDLKTLIVIEICSPKMKILGS